MEKELPKGWVEVQLIDLLESLETGSRPKGGVQGILDGIPSIGGEHLNNNGGFKFENIKYVPIKFAASMNRGKIKEKDVLIVKDGATTGKTSFVNSSFPFKQAFVNEHVFLCRPYKQLNPKCIYYFLRSDSGQERIMRNFAGAAQGGINTKFSNNTLIPLPPLPEQQRIVDKLDNLFKHLDALNTRLDRIPQLLKDFRQKVLTQAVTGKLTEEWREGKELEEWKIEIASKCCDKVQSGGTPKGGGFTDEGIPFLKVYNIVNNQIDFEYRPQFVTTEVQNKALSKSIAYPGDVLMNIVGPPLNKIAILPTDYPEWNLNQAITLFRAKKYLLNIFLYYFFCEGKSVREIMGETKGVVGQINISLSQCRDFEIPIPTLVEQQEIVRRVESLFAKADQIEASYQKLKTKIEQLPQALLAKAFRGELVEQLSTDGDANQLLEEIRKAKAGLEKGGRTKRMKENDEVRMVAEDGVRYGE